MFARDSRCVCLNNWILLTETRWVPFACILYSLKKTKDDARNGAAERIVGKG